MVELVNTNNLGLFDREIVQVQVLFPLVDLFYINPASFIPPEPPPRGRLAFSKGGSGASCSNPQRVRSRVAIFFLRLRPSKKLASSGLGKI